MNYINFKLYIYIICLDGEVAEDAVDRRDGLGEGEDREGGRLFQII